MFGLNASQEDSYVTIGRSVEVGFNRPIYKPGDYLEKGTRFLRPIKYEFSDEPFTSYDHSKGTTHRWNYSFTRRPKFLSFYWSRDLRPIRPLIETLERIVNPEHSVVTPYDHEVLLISHLVDNFENEHVRNWVYHMMYDTKHIANVYDWNNLQLPEKYNLFNKYSDYSVSFRLKPKTKTQRAWYRRIEEVYDLSNEPTMRAFNLEFEKHIDTAFKVRKKIGGVGMRYSTRNMLKELILRGYKGKDFARKLSLHAKIYRPMLRYDQIEKLDITDFELAKSVQQQLVSEWKRLSVASNFIPNFLRFLITDS
jgi:hypothetical protein